MQMQININAYAIIFMELPGISPLPILDPSWPTNEWDDS
jgi:hypothetical protein